MKKMPITDEVSKLFTEATLTLDDLLEQLKDENNNEAFVCSCMRLVDYRIEQLENNRHLIAGMKDELWEIAEDTEGLKQYINIAERKIFGFFKEWVFNNQDEANTLLNEILLDRLNNLVWHCNVWGSLINDVLSELKTIAGGNQQTNNDLYLPVELDTPFARIVFVEAVKLGWLEISPNGFKWLDYDGKNGYGSKTRLAYFLSITYKNEMRHKGNFDMKAIDRLFNVDRMAETIRKMYVETESGKPQMAYVIDNFFKTIKADENK